MTTDKNNPKYISIMQTAHELFWKHGFKRITVEEICRKSQVSKMTFYRFFPNKTFLATCVYDEVIEDGLAKFNRIMEEQSSGAEKLKKIILLKAEGTNNLSREFMDDFYLGNQPELKAYVEEKTKQVWAQMFDGFKHAQEQGWFRKDFKPEFLFRISFSFIELMKDQELLSLYDNPQDLILEFTNMIAYGISNH